MRPGGVLGNQRRKPEEKYMSKFVRDSAVYPFTPATDMTNNKGYTVTLAGETATLSASATVPAEGVVLDGEPTTGKASVAILGAGIPPVLMKCSGTITKGDKVAQHTDGRIKTDPGTGARVVLGIAMEDGVADELIEVATFTPITFTA